MKRLPEGTIRKILDFSAETDLSLEPYALEKDQHVLDAIRIIRSVPQHRLFRLVFCGGTCLSKAYGILERMSEDVDFKVVPTAAAEGMGRSELRRELGAFAKFVAGALEQGGFGKGSTQRTALDNNTYTRLDVKFDSAFDKPESLRSHLLIELNFTRLSGNTQTKPIGLLLDMLTSGSYAAPLVVECVSLEEALAEKIVSFPRRLAAQLARHPDPGAALDPANNWDPALVRHLYDVHRLTTRRPELLANLQEMKRMVESVVSKDTEDFGNQHARFREDARNELRSAIGFAKGSAELAGQYDRFVRDMVYAQGSGIPSYAVALNTLESALTATIGLGNAASATANQPAAITRRGPAGGRTM